MTWLVTVGAVLMLAWQFGKDLVDEANLAHLRYESQLIANDLTEQVDRRLRALERLERSLRGVEPEELSERLASHQVLLEWFEGLMVTEADGRVMADLPEIPGRAGLETAETEYFNRVRHSPWPYVSRPFTGRVSGDSLVLMLVPRFDEQGSFAGIVGGMVNLSHGGMFRRLEAIRLGENGYVSVLTAGGELLFHPRRYPRVSGVDSFDDSEALELALLGWEGETVANGAGDTPALMAYRQIWPADWVVKVALPQAQVQEPLGDFLIRLWWAWLVLAMLLLVTMRWLVQRLLKPLHRLERQIAQVGAGKRRYLELSTSMQELSQVASSFNRLERERLTALENLRDRQAFLDAVLGSTPLGMFVADLKGHVNYLNPSLLELLGFDVMTTARDWWERIHPDDREGTQDMWRHTLATGSDFVRQLRFLRPDGVTLWVEVHASQVKGNDQPLGFVGMVKDITERRQQEALQRWEAEHDPLTGLLNRRGFERRLEEALAEYAKTGTPSVLILFDLDHFKPINDEGGHAMGDEMLRRVAQVVAWEVRRSDHVARQGGDEFAVLLPSCTLKQAGEIAESLRRAVSEVTVSSAGKVYSITLSMGVTALQEGDDSIEPVLARADQASYQAKAAGRNTVVIAASDEDLVDSLW
ncbi:diguanylate cyclase [Halomonas kenyensis]|uniref:Diguanylate cyclase n=2 Tax=Billgrantia kenyensis TaxID=321266 RepID=A0A7V9W1V0_9GAMM|nr:diguanylate cyclase [Halomonas kenyensis]MBA2779503.1 diguanylate cyclase [Halomonas kenyensis]MCG6662736.1 diguanylate cyclase [Halomonas kenyensis]